MIDPLRLMKTLAIVSTLRQVAYWRDAFRYSCLSYAGCRRLVVRPSFHMSAFCGHRVSVPGAPTGATPEQ
jgi:hypothetical protein